MGGRSSSPDFSPRLAIFFSFFLCSVPLQPYTRLFFLRTMTLLLTKSCDYALLVAIEEGKHFSSPADDDKDLFIHSRLDLPMPEPMEDLIPPPTLITTQPIPLSSAPQWQTTLVYFLSSKILRRLRQHGASVKMQILTLSVDGDTEVVGRVDLPLDAAKVVVMKDGKRPLSCVKDYVIDKGAWHPLRAATRTPTNGQIHATNPKIKVGLFVVDMPPPAGATNAVHGMPIPIPTTTAANYQATRRVPTDQSGLELQAIDESILLDNGNSNSNSNSISSHGVRKQGEGMSTPPLMPPQHVQVSGSSSYVQIGNGTDHHTFVLRVKDALVPRAMEGRSDNDKIDENGEKNTKRWIKYTFPPWQIRHAVNATWQVVDPPMCLALQGSLDDIRRWLADQDAIAIGLYLDDTLVGTANVLLQGFHHKGSVEQASFPLHDSQNRWHLQPDNQLAKVTVQVGLTPGWTQ
ncbi:hypothetical protein BC940DRAFT_308765 [Gongronella butleri]|nr:hypothetical protein BC940DRAFT_308765 [Gongronella butleri]